MTRVKMMFAILLVTTSIVSYAQSQSTPNLSDRPKLIAVVNKANWCLICKANGDRFAQLIMPYTSKGLNIYINDISNDSTKALSKHELEKENIYDAVITTPRRGMGKMLQSCGLAKDKKQTFDVSGIVTFIDPKTHKQLKQISIGSPDKEMKTTIENLLKS